MTHEPTEPHDPFTAEARERANQMIETGVEVVNNIERIVGAPLVPAAEKRDETPLPEGVELTKEMEAAVREEAAKLGIGMAEDRGVAEMGLPTNTLVLIEGGQRHKVEAEKRLVGEGPIVFSGTTHLALGGAEKELTERLFGSCPENEYDMVVESARAMEGFVAAEQPEVVGYITYDGQLADHDEQATGTLLKLGNTTEGQGVYALDVPRKYLVDAEGKPVLDAKGNQKYEQPNAAQQLLAVMRLVRGEAGAVATSATYNPSRQLEAIRVSHHALKLGQKVPRIEVVAYCPATLAEIKGEKTPVLPSVAHILGEIHATRASLTKLSTELS